MDTIEIYKDNFKPSRPWCADLYRDGEPPMYKYLFEFSTKKALLRELSHFADTKIVRSNDIDVLRRV